jgi:hypothetical protein
MNQPLKRSEWQDLHPPRGSEASHGETCSAKHRPLPEHANSNDPAILALRSSPMHGLGAALAAALLLIGLSAALSLTSPCAADDPGTIVGNMLVAGCRQAGASTP